MHSNIFYLNLPHHVTAKSCTPSLSKPGTHATPASSPQKITFPGWRPSWAWYLAEAPALSAVACNPVPALTLLSGCSPPETKHFEPLRRRERLAKLSKCLMHTDLFYFVPLQLLLISFVFCFYCLADHTVSFKDGTIFLGRVELRGNSNFSEIYIFKSLMQVQC